MVDIFESCKNFKNKLIAETEFASLDDIKNYRESKIIFQLKDQLDEIQDRLNKIDS